MINAREVPTWDMVESECVPSDLPSLNEITDGGFRTSNFIVVQAGTGCGKTTFLIRSAIKALFAKKKVLFISAGEETEQDIIMHFKCMIAGVDYHRASKNLYTQEEIDKIEALDESIFDNLWVEFYANPMGFVLTDQEKISESGIKYIFIDYLGCFLAEKTNEQYSFLTKTASDLKAFADTHHICIMTAMQTNRTLKAELQRDDLDLSTIDETFMADSIGPARKATLALSLVYVEKRRQMYLIVYKNRLNGKRKVIPIDVKPKTFRMVELFNEKEGF
ncbi:MAG: hypothetical protein MJZ37_08885 [Bacilli bacterium]|nr:hypothetical protein [Bacilli bacterium]